MSLTGHSFTPSEYILLNGEKFAPPAEGLDSLALLICDGKVSGPRLVVSMLMAAILANESEGGLEILKSEKKGLFNTAPRNELRLRVIRNTLNWSGYTLESAVMFIAGNLFSIQKNTVYNIIYTLLAKDRPDPWQKVIELVEWGLASSNWLLPVEGEAAAAFSTPFICPARVRELVLEQSAQPVISLLTTFREQRPELHRAITQEIERALKDRQI
jgi:hypothetical protein